MIFIVPVPGIKAICYKIGCLDRPGSYYDMQNEYSDDDSDQGPSVFEPPQPEWEDDTFQKFLL